MKEYRTADECASYRDESERVGIVLDRAVANIADVYVTAELGESQEDYERAVDAVWDGLRDELDDEDRLRAIVDLLQDRGRERADETLHGIKRGSP